MFVDLCCDLPDDEPERQDRNDWLPSLALSMDDYYLVLKNGKWLTDSLIDAAQTLLKHYFFVLLLFVAGLYVGEALLYRLNGFC